MSSSAATMEKRVFQGGNYRSSNNGCRCLHQWVERKIAGATFVRWHLVWFSFANHEIWYLIEPMNLPNARREKRQHEEAADRPMLCHCLGDADSSHEGFATLSIKSFLIDSIAPTRTAQQLDPERSHFPSEKLTSPCGGGRSRIRQQLSSSLAISSVGSRGPNEILLKSTHKPIWYIIKVNVSLIIRSRAKSACEEPRRESFARISQRICFFCLEVKADGILHGLVIDFGCESTIACLRWFMIFSSISCRQSRRVNDETAKSIALWSSNGNFDKVFSTSPHHITNLLSATWVKRFPIGPWPDLTSPHLSPFSRCAPHGIHEYWLHEQLTLIQSLLRRRIAPQVNIYWISAELLFSQLDAY